MMKEELHTAENAILYCNLNTYNVYLMHIAQKLKMPKATFSILIDDGFSNRRSI